MYDLKTAHGPNRPAASSRIAIHADRARRDEYHLSAASGLEDGSERGRRAAGYTDNEIVAFGRPVASDSIDDGTGG